MNPSQAPSPLELRDVFPSYNIVTFLLGHYFNASSVHWLCPIVHRPGFDEAYLQWHHHGSHYPNPDFHALLAIVCALSLQFLPESEEDVNCNIHL